MPKVKPPLHYPTVSSDPGTMDYYQAWANWLGIDATHINFNSPHVVEQFNNLINTELRNRQNAGLPATRATRPWPQPQVAPLSQETRSGKPTNQPPPAPDPNEPPYLAPPYSILQDPKILEGTGGTTLQQFNNFARDPTTEAGDRLNRLKGFEEAEAEPQHYQEGGKVPGATDAELAELANTLLAKEQQPQPDYTPTAQEAAAPWLRRAGAATPSDQQPQFQPTAREIEDAPWLARQQPQAPTAADDQALLKSALDAYGKSRTPLEWAEDVVKPSPMQQFTEQFTRRAVEDVAGIAGAAMRTVSGAGAGAESFITGVQVPDLQGKSVDQVKALREQMLAQKADLEKRKDRVINSGTGDDASVYSYIQTTNGLDQRIKEADGIIASGKPQTAPSVSTDPLIQGLNYGGRTFAPATSKFLDKYVPTDEEFAKSFPGQIATGGADALTLSAASALGGPVGGVVAGGLLMGNQAYDDAKAHGASDEVADNAGLITSLLSGGTMAVLGPVVGGLAKNYAGMTAKQGMNAIVQAFTYAGIRAGGGGAEFAVMQAEQNAIAKLTGYDPNRKLDAGTWKSFWTGVMYESVNLAVTDLPHIQKMFKADVTVRNKDGAPPQTGEQTQVTPGAPTAPPPPVTTPEAQAQAAVTTATTGTPEQVIAQANPEAELNKFIATEGGQAQPERGFVQVGGTPPVYTGPERPAPRPTLQLAGGERDAAAMPVAATEHGAEPVPSNTPGPPTTVPAVTARTMGNVEGAPADTPEGRAEMQRMVDEETRRSAELVYDQIKHNQGAVPFEEFQRQIGASVPEDQVRGLWEGFERQARVNAFLKAGYTEEEANRYAGAVAIRAPEAERGFPPTYVDEYGREIPPGPGQAKEIERAAGASTRMAAERAKGAAPADNFTKPRGEKKLFNLKGQWKKMTLVQAATATRGEIRRDADGKHWEAGLGGSVTKAAARRVDPVTAETTGAQRPAWYEKEELASLPPEARPEPPDRTIGPADVKKEVNDAQAQMGMEDHLHYVANAEALPDHVKKGLTEGERANTAQIVRDNKLGDIYVIGDRFDSLNDLRRKIVEETLPYHYRNVTKVGLTHDNTDPRPGHYDILSDRPILNTHAIISHETPYAEASRALMEEADVHQGISKLLGDRNGPVYTQVMGQLLQNFRRLGLIDKLAQLRGYENAQHMAQRYGVPKWETDPRQANKFTEELAAGYSRNFRNADELMRDGPSWWQNGLRRMNNAIRQFLGIRLSDYDVQSLLVDSAAALRSAKMDDHVAQFHPIGDAAKQDMRDFQMASLPPEKTATEAGETADIGTELVKAQARRLQASLKPGQFIREQNLKRAMDTTHGLQERLNLLRANDAVENEEGHREVMEASNRVFRENFNGNANEALQHLIDDETKPIKQGAAVPTLNEVVDRNTDRRVVELRDAGLNDEANLLAARLDRMNQIQGRRVTETARELNAQKLRHVTGSAAVADSKNQTQDAQRQEIEKPTQANNKRKVDEGFDKVKEATEAAAGSLRDKVKKATAAKPKPPTKPGEEKPTYRRIGPGWGLREQHVQDLVDRIDDAVSKGGAVEDKGGLAQVYDSFRKTLLQIIRERTPPEEREAKPISPMSTLRDIMSNYPAYEEAWKRTMDMLQTKDPALAQRFSSAIEEPVGETLANKLAGEQGIDLSDLIYSHYSTTDRINTDLATKIAQAATEGRLGPGQEWLANLQNAQGLAGHLQRLFGDIVDKEQKARLQSILDNMGGTHKPTPTELDQLLNHIAIGGLDSSEWLNVVGPRFGIEGYTPEKLDALRASGDYMMRLRDEGLDNSAIAQKTRAQIAQLTQLNDDPWLTKQFKYLNDVYTSGLLTGPMTHIPYWQQGLLTQAMDTTVQGIRAAIKAKDPYILLQMWPKAMAGYARGIGEFGAIFRGIKPAETFFPEGISRPPGPMEATPERKLSNFRYVRNTLEAVANLMTKGPAYAIHYANMRYLLDENPDLTPQAAHEAASEVVLGSKDARDRAIRDAKDIAERYGLDKDQHKMLQGELLDQYKTTSDLPDSSLANAETERLRDVATRAYDTGLGGSLRGDVRGTMGFISRGLLSFANKYPYFRPIAEFLKVPFNAINEFLAWTPLGITRSARDLVPADTPLLGRAVTEFPLTRGGIESYIGKVPGMEKKIESGEFSQDHIRDIAWNQMSKGLVGSTVGGFLFGVVRSLLSNPNPPIQFSFQGPSQYGQQEVERGKGWQPRSVKIGGAWHSYENTPWRMLFSALGAYEDYFRYEKQNPDAFSNEAIAAWRGMAGGVTSAFGSPLQGLDALLNYFTQFGGQDAQREVGNFATQLVGSLLTTPLGGTFTRQLYRSFIDQTEYEGDNIWEKSLRYVPVVNAWAAQQGFLRPKLNVFGEHMTSTGLKAFPEYGNVVPNDPVWSYLDKHPGIKLTMPGNQGGTAGIKMTPDEIYQYHLARGPALKEQIARAINTPSFRAMPVDMQNYYIHKYYEPMANRIGHVAVMKYRQEHPVTAERQAQSRIGQLEEMMKEEQSTKLPEE